MPRLSDTMEEGTLVKWYKQEGDFVQEGEILFEVETDKAVLEVEAFRSGILSQILVQEGEKVPVGTPIAILGGEVGKIVPQNEPPVEKSPPAKTTPPISLNKEKTAPRLSVVPTKGKTVLPGVQEGIKASPAARSLARQKDIDLSFIKGSGEGGMITLKDVRDFSKSSARKVESVSPVQSTVVFKGETTKLSKMRKAIAATVSYSKQHIPHFYVSYEIEMTNVITQLDERNRSQTAENKITINDVIIRAVSKTLKDSPSLNAIYPQQGIVLQKAVNMGIVLGLPEGLIIPVLKNCDTLTLEEISEGVKRLRQKIKTGKFSPADFTDGTFTISNLGMLGVSDFAAIIYPPQIAILAVSVIKDTALVKDGVIIPSKIMKVTLSLDHRVVDGIYAATFLRDIKKHLETEPLEPPEKPCCTVDDD